MMQCEEAVALGILGIGHDVVDVRAFGEQLAEPGSRMRALFSARELRQARMRAELKHDGESVHLAGKWAAKESVVKAWCAALGGGSAPYTLDNTPWSGIEILGDARGVPHVLLQAGVHAELVRSLACPVHPLRAQGVCAADAMPAGAAACTDGGLRWHLSISHDGPIASAVAVLERAE
ncbi:Holo-[acyl-carrier protein] synthase [Bifidobacterium pseudolongum subsp. globosum]|uniref:Holo-[acyl-carrier-protein] synthase n=1 Tax=Bifidobacterium pseudolongum subsp. globosum TaxID=1690 RepID=A0A4Q5A3Y0_9BIFI|nr:holo-ACP synthase [Bifidobacterium pseudolongum]RYQ11645.1 Holo-[acyl-carrier protein] synthase [Bifidobacterium pseudolongum subsp. globosum]